MGAVGSLAAVSLLGSPNPPATAQTTGPGSDAALPTAARRRGGALEVSSVGVGVQNVSRTYQTTIPTRPGMLNIIRTAFDRGATFFDAAEACGPHEAERILGEGVAPFRDEVVMCHRRREEDAIANFAEDGTVVPQKDPWGAELEAAGSPAPPWR
jgi:hypothetical protein